MNEVTLIKEMTTPDGVIIKYVKTCQAVCSQQIGIAVEGDIIREVAFAGGCSGNTQGIAKLVEGMKVSDAISRLEGIRCGSKQTSCPDQLARALKLFL